MAGKTAEGEVPLELTPTWVVAVVCAIIIIISLAMERSLHLLGEKLKTWKLNTLYEALLKVKEELMLLGFISLLLMVLQGSIHRICVPRDYMVHMQPCKKDVAATAHYGSTTLEGVLGGHHRRLFATGDKSSDVCVSKGKVPVLSLDAIHKLHIFIFVLAITHVLFTASTMGIGLLRIKKWKAWEKSIRESVSQNDPTKIIHVSEDNFIKGHYKGFDKVSSIITWLYCFCKKIFGSIRKEDYKALRLGFIEKHFPGNQTYNFFKYMMRNLESDFKKVVGLSWYLWIFVIIFVLLSVDGWHLYFWISFLPLILLLAVGTKLEHVIVKLASGVAHKSDVVIGQLVIKPSNDHFWFGRPQLVLYLIHFILFQNAFDMAYFFWILTSFGIKSCMMGPVGFVVARLALGVIIQILCSYSTLPLYAIITQMRDTPTEDMFEANVQESIRGWAKTAKTRGGTKETPTKPQRVSEGSPDVLLHNVAGTGEIHNERPDRSSV